MRGSPTRTRLSIGVLCFGLVVLSSGCELFAVGEVHQIVVAIPSELREALGDDLRAALEPRMFTSRSEGLFDVAYVDPGDPSWRRLRLVRHILLVGTAADPLVSEALSRRQRDLGDSMQAKLIQVSNVWAKRQIVTVALLPPGADDATVRRLLATAGDTYAQQFSELIHARTTRTGMRTTAASRFGRGLGFSLVLPASYRHEEPQTGVFVFQHDDPNPAAPVIRMITVASRVAGDVGWSANEARAWREQIAGEVSHPPQVTDTVVSAVQGIRGGRRVIELRGSWQNPPGEWLAAGPFITQIVECPDRMYLVDAWLYAPASAKYELIAQLEMILGTFRCGEWEAVAA